MPHSQMNKSIIVAIDGPAGSGKSTTARALAARLKLPYIDTGAMYRALTFVAMKEGVDWSDEKALIRLAKKADIDLKRSGNGKHRVSINGMDVTKQIRTPELTKNVHHVASCPGVRTEMVRLQRKFGQRRGGVLEGRDIGTVVFPKATFKFYLDAAFWKRVERRRKEFLAKGIKAPLKEVEKDLKARDRKDFTRKVGPLKAAKDARVVDTTALTIPQSVVIISRFILTGKKPGKRA